MTKPMPNKDADTKNSPKEELLDSVALPAEADNTSIPKPPNSGELKPDPELAALRDIALRYFEGATVTDGEYTTKVEEVDEMFAKIGDVFTAQHNVLLDKVLGLIPKPDPNAQIIKPTLLEPVSKAIGYNQALADVRAEVERLKQ